MRKNLELLLMPLKKFKEIKVMPLSKKAIRETACTFSRVDHLTARRCSRQEMTQLTLKFMLLEKHLASWPYYIIVHEQQLLALRLLT